MSEERRSRRRKRREVIGRGAIGSWETLWSEERLGVSSLTATSRIGLLFSGCLRSSWPSDPSFTIWYAYLKVYSSTVCSTVISHVTLVSVW